MVYVSRWSTSSQVELYIYVHTFFTVHSGLIPDMGTIPIKIIGKSKP